MTIQENIVANVKTVLTGVAGIAAVERWNDKGQTSQDSPRITIWWDNIRRDENCPNAKQQWWLGLTLDVRIFHNHATETRTTDEVVIELFGKIYDALMADERRGGYALNTHISGADIIPPVISGPGTQFTIDVDVMFRHHLRDSSSQGAGI